MEVPNKCYTKESEIKTSKAAVNYNVRLPGDLALARRNCALQTIEGDQILGRLGYVAGDAFV